jgi:hypothetical protein
VCFCLFNLKDLPLLVCRGRECRSGQHGLRRDSDCGIGRGRERRSGQHGIRRDSDCGISRRRERRSGQHRLLRDSDCGIGDAVRSSGALKSLGDDYALDLLIGVSNLEEAFGSKECLKIVDRLRILVFSQHSELGQHSHRELELSCEPFQIRLEGLLRVISRL